MTRLIDNYYISMSGYMITKYVIFLLSIICFAQADSLKENFGIYGETGSVSVIFVVNNEVIKGVGLIGNHYTYRYDNNGVILTSVDNKKYISSSIGNKIEIRFLLNALSDIKSGTNFNQSYIGISLYTETGGVVSDYVSMSYISDKYYLNRDSLFLLSEILNEIKVDQKISFDEITDLMYSKIKNNDGDENGFYTKLDIRRFVFALYNLCVINEGWTLNNNYWSGARFEWHDEYFLSDQTIQYIFPFKQYPRKTQNE